MYSVRPIYWNIWRTISCRRGQESRQKRFCSIRTTFEPTCWWWWWRQSVTEGSKSFHIRQTHREWPPPTLSSPKHEKHMTGKRYETDDDVIGTVRSHVEDLPEKSCWNGIKKCFQRNNYLEDVKTWYTFPRKKIVVTSLRLTRALLGLWIFHDLLGGVFEHPPPVYLGSCAS